jgi:hypothetical protein
VAHSVVERFTKKMLVESEVEAMQGRLGHPTQDEVRMTVAQILDVDDIGAVMDGP